MPAIVSNSTPLIHLARIGQLDLLRDFFGKVMIPPAVYEECVVQGKAYRDAQLIAQAEWLEIKPVSDSHLVILLNAELDRGEAEAIALALQQPTDLLLLDDAEGRGKARLYGLKYTGTVATFHAMLAVFEQHNGETPQKIREALQKGNQQSAEILAHSLKGVSAILGMHQLEDLAASIEHKIHEGSSENALDKELIALAAALSSVLDEIEAIDVHKSANSNTDRVKVAKMLSDLVALLEKDDMRAYALWRELEPSLSLTIGKNDIAAVSQKIEAFDFPSALSILKAVIALHPKLTNG